MSNETTSLSFPLTLVFHSDWGVSTGTGVVGGVDSVIETDTAGQPVVRGTVLTGVVRAQARQAAAALDNGPSGRWNSFADQLFGPAPDDTRKASARPRHSHVIFSDACVPVGQRVPVHEVISLSIDEQTGTARENFLRFFERAGGCQLQGTVTLVDVDAQGHALRWTEAQRDAARLLLSLAGLLVRGIGSNRSDGDGVCDVLIGQAAPASQGSGLEQPNLADAATHKQAVRRWCAQALDSLEPTATAGDIQLDPSVPTPAAPWDSPEVPHPGQGGVVPARVPAGDGAGPASQWYTTTLRIDLLTPLVSYEVPFSNEVRSLDFLRGTVVLPWVHRLLRRALPDDPVVRDAVVSGRLLVSDALPVVQGCPGLPTPLVLTRPKADQPGQWWLAASNRLLAAPPPEVQSPMRSGFVFPGVAMPGQQEAQTQAHPGDQTQQAQPAQPLSGAWGVPALTGRQGTAHSAQTGAAKDGSLFLVRALPAGMRLEATVTLSKDLAERPGVRQLLSRMAGADRSVEARLGLRRLSGAYGQTRCCFTPLAEVTAPQVQAGTTTLWFTADVLARSAALGPGGSLTDLLGAFRRAGADLRLAEGQADRYRAGIRHRRVDTWSPASSQPRATRMAVQAGSVLRVEVPPEATTALARLAVTGVGSLTAQGFGRFVVGHPLLEQEAFNLRTLRRHDFIHTAQEAQS